MDVIQYEFPPNLHQLAYALTSIPQEILSPLWWSGGLSPLVYVNPHDQSSNEQDASGDSRRHRLLGAAPLRSFADNLQANFPLALAFTHLSIHPPKALLNAIPQALHFQVDLSTGDGLNAISDVFGQPDVVINCAALSVPRVCEMDPEAAMSINVPTTLVKWLSSFREDTLLIHLSTDQVYEGTKSFYKEEDETVPVNTYGKSKVEAEHYVSANCQNFAILRSSIIYGPQTLSPVPKSLPIQAKQVQLILNVGGPDRLSRVQMAEAVAHVRGYNTSLIKPVSASSVDRGVKSPSDISMDITKLIQTTGISPTSYTEGVRLTLEAEDRS
ncbi:hypothetical protein DH2020_023174 [Rehmannia glutinosa]|uniref:RmlD-like substrate binding domain-containing protein n=1 Tax=Rehmannia glutinosa TaxID=99300 RepID=A0ABR0W7V3_REHGL